MARVSTSLAACLVACMCTSALIAGNTGKISGIVRDARTQEPLPGVNIVVAGTTLGAASNIEGQYVILNVPPGRYQLLASFVGYKRYAINDVRVNVDFTTKLDINLEEGSVELDAVVIQAERSPLIRQDLTNPVASISSEVIDALPVTDISQVIGLQAGVVVGDDGVLHIRGGLGNEIAYTLNGVSLNNPYGNTRSVSLATNAVQEVSVSSGTFNAEYGNALSGVVNYVTREGGGKYTASVRYLTGDYLSTRTDPFEYIDDFQINNTYRTEFSVGGPIFTEVLAFYGSGVYNYSNGYLYATQLYTPEDAHLSREGFPSGDPRSGPSGDPLYFGPARNPQTDTVGLPSGNGDIVALNWGRSYNLQGNLSLRISPEMRMKYEFVYDYGQNPSSSSIAYRFRPDGRAISTGEGFVHSIEWTHTVSERMFYTAKGSYIIDKSFSRTFDTVDDPRYLPSFYQTVLPGTSFLTGGTDLGRFSQFTHTLAGKVDLVAQLWGNHEVKAGIEVRSHKLQVEAYTLQFRDPANPSQVPNWTSFLTTGGQLQAYVPDVSQGYVYYERKPLQLAAYLQDKIELFTSIILNLGLRYEYYDPAAQYNPTVGEEYASVDSLGFYDEGLTDAAPKHMVSPRVSVSYPITDQGTIRFSYGHFYQMGSLASLYSNPYYRAPLGTTPSFGNPNVEPQKSIQYEIGLQQGLTEDLKVEITGYYKDVSNYIYSQLIQTERGDKPYYLLTNLSYANTRGVSISLVKRRSPTDLLSMTLDYTFQVAEGNRTEPEEEIFYNEQIGRLTETYLVPFDFDRSHTLTTAIALTQPDDWNVSMIGYLRTGTPYTPEFPANVVPITFVQNSDRQPVQWNVNLKAEKFFRFDPVLFSVYIQVDNLFDTANELYTYASTGRALYDIQQTTNPNRFINLEKRIARGDPGLIPQSVLTNYYADPRNLSAPRLFRIGASIQL